MDQHNSEDLKNTSEYKKYLIYGVGKNKSNKHNGKNKNKTKQMKRIIHYDVYQDDNFYEFRLKIFGIGDLDGHQLMCQFSNRTCHFMAIDLYGEDIHFMVPIMANEVNPRKCKFSQIDKNNLKIVAQKKYPGHWNELVYHPPIVKNNWELEMTTFLNSTKYNAFLNEKEKDTAMKEIWKESLLLYTDDYDFYLHCPEPYGPILNIEKSENIENMTKIVKSFLENKSTIRLHQVHFLGAVILYRLHLKHKCEYPEISADEPCDDDAPAQHPKGNEELLRKSLALRLEADKLKEEGNAFYRSNEFELAIKCYNNAIDIFPDCPIYYCNRSSSHFALKRYQQSFIDACMTLELDPLHSKGFIKAVDSLMALELPDLAVRISSFAKDFDKENCKVYVCTMMTALKMSQLKDEEEEDYKSTRLYMFCNRLISEKMPNFNKINCINNFFQNRDITSVEIYCQKLLSSTKIMTLANAYYYLGYTALCMDERYEAQIYINNCLKYNPTHQRGKILQKEVERFYEIKNKAFNCFIADDFEQCVSLYKTGFEIDPSNECYISHFHFMIGLVHKASGSNKEAIQSLTQAIKHYSNNFMAYFVRSQLHINNKKMTRNDFCYAINAYRKHTKEIERRGVTNAQSNPNAEMIDLYRNLAQNAAFNSRYEKSDHYLQMAIMFEPHRPQLYRQYSMCLRFMGLEQFGIVISEKGLSKDPRNGCLFLEKGKCLLEMGKSKEAMKCFEEADELQPFNQEVIRAKKSAVMFDSHLKEANKAKECKDYLKGKHHFQAALDIAPSSTSVEHNLFQCQEHLNLASGHSHRKRSKNRATAKKSLLLGTNAYQKGEKETALKELKKARDLDPDLRDAGKAFSLATEMFSLLENGHKFLLEKNYSDARDCFSDGAYRDQGNMNLTAKMLHGKGLCHMGCAEYEAAVQEFSRCMEVNPFAEVYLSRGECYDHLCEYKKTFKDYQKALNLKPNAKTLQLVKDAKIKLNLGLSQTVKSDSV